MFQLRLFAMLVGFGASIGLWRFCCLSKRDEPLKEAFTGLWILLGGLVGARAGYVLVHSEYFRNHPGLTLQFWQGGLNGFGLITGMLVFTLLAAFARRADPLEMLDRVGRMAAPLSTAAWLGLWSEGVAYGALLAPGTPWGVMTPDESGAFSLRFPLQFAAAFSFLLLALLVERLTRNAKPGFFAGVLLIVLAVHAFVVSIFRVDPVRPLFHLGLDTALSMILLILSAIFMIFLILHHRKKGIKSDAGSDAQQASILTG